MLVACQLTMLACCTTVFPHVLLCRLRSLSSKRCPQTYHVTRSTLKSKNLQPTSQDPDPCICTLPSETLSNILQSKAGTSSPLWAPKSGSQRYASLVSIDVSVVFSTELGAETSRAQPPDPIMFASHLFRTLGCAEEWGFHDLLFGRETERELNC